MILEGASFSLVQFVHQCHPQLSGASTSGMHIGCFTGDSLNNPRADAKGLGTHWRSGTPDQISPSVRPFAGGLHPRRHGLRLSVAPGHVEESKPAAGLGRQLAGKGSRRAPKIDVFLIFFFFDLVPKPKQIPPHF